MAAMACSSSRFEPMARSKNLQGANYIMVRQDGVIGNLENERGSNLFGGTTLGYIFWPGGCTTLIKNISQWLVLQGLSVGR